MKNILIAGGSGFIGSELKKFFRQSGYKVYVLTRKPKRKGDIYWSPKRKKIEGKHLGKIEILVNLCGANISSKKWSNKRKDNLISSRVRATEYLFFNKDNFPNLKKYIGISGVNCFGNTNDKSFYNEKDAYGIDFLSSLVEKWETAHSLFSKEYSTSIIRLPVVLHKNKGILKKMETPFSIGLGSILGNGNQIINWISTYDLKEAFNHVIKNNIEGPIQLCASNTSNADFTKALAKAMNKKLFIPKMPTWFLKLIFGEMHTLLLNGNYISSEKIKSTNFNYQHTDINDFLSKMYSNKLSI